MTYNNPPYADYPAFNIKASTVGSYSNTKIISVEIYVDVRYSGPRDETNMAVINVKLLSGFKLDEESLRPLSSESTLKHVDQEDGNVIICLDETAYKQQVTSELECVDSTGAVREPESMTVPSSQVVRNSQALLEVSQCKLLEPLQPWTGVLLHG
ncbi:uncharacterized protein LOC118799978 [Colossoma macropomum]|uniref:uncharacterized protein LOC118799978 n=1 Tax=Colossoma macropomum TaxID=42526 RepID=UPI0018651DB4|nr:uncharacterized protein LOC118799978 [Colossoma macropomum]XP_036416029.1 uncharacterized protein LOC118799978 [Colossoma macropomum]